MQLNNKQTYKLAFALTQQEAHKKGDTRGFLKKNKCMYLLGDVMGTHAVVRDNPQVSAFSLYHISSGDLTQLICPGNKYPYLLSHISSLKACRDLDNNCIYI